MRILVGAGLSLVLLGCGILEPAGMTGEVCGAAICGSGTYCADAEFETCKEGCRADLNCQEAQRCALSQGELVGVCEERPKVTGPASPASDRNYCFDACDSYEFFDCEGDSLEDCYETCAGLEGEAAEAFSECINGPYCNYQDCS